MAKIDVALLKTDAYASKENEEALSRFLNDGYVIDKMTLIGQYQREILYVFVRHNQSEED